MPPAKTTEVPRREAHSYSAKAREFSNAGETALAEGLYDAALLNAVHAGISAADAVCVALAGRRSADPDHRRAIELLEQVAGRSPDAVAKIKQLRLLLAKKNVVEYESRRTTAKEARESTARAERLVSWAQETIEKAKL